MQIRSKILELEAQLIEERHRLTQLQGEGSTYGSTSGSAPTAAAAAAVSGSNGSTGAGASGRVPTGMTSAAVPSWASHAPPSSMTVAAAAQPPLASSSGWTGHSDPSGCPAELNQQEQPWAPTAGGREAAPPAHVAAPGGPAAGPPARRGGLNITFTRRTGQPEGSPPGGALGVGAALPSSSAVSGDTVSYQSASSHQHPDDDDAANSATSRGGTAVRQAGPAIATTAHSGGNVQLPSVRQQASPFVIDLTDD